MATQEIMTDNQPVERDIQQTGNEIISLKNQGIYSQRCVERSKRVDNKI